MNQNLLDFNRAWEISDNMIYKDAAWQQNNFIRDVVCRGLLGVIPFKVSEHTSKSIKLPVYGFVMDNGIVIVARENFYGWKLSVKSPRPLPIDYLPTDILEGVYNENCENKNKIYSCYLEGFKEGWSYDAYNPKDDKQTEFTIGVYDNYNFYMLMYLLNKAFSPMSFNASDDKRSVDEIAESISEIKNCQPNMDSWEVFPLTRRQVEVEFNGYVTFETYDDAKKYAELIVGDSKVHEVFLMEEYMYKYNF